MLHFLEKQNSPHDQKGLNFQLLKITPKDGKASLSKNFKIPTFFHASLQTQNKGISKLVEDVAGLIR